MPSKQLSARPVFLILPLLILGGYFGYTQYMSYLDNKARDDAVERNRQASDPMRATDLDGFKRAFLIPNEGMHATTAAYKNNNWHRTETARYQATIDNSRYDYIVLPVVESIPNIDRVSRLMPARLIARELEAQLGKKVLSPELTLRVIGPRASLLEDQKVIDLASRVGADVIYLYLKFSSRSDLGNSSLAAVVTGIDGTIKHRLVLELEAITPDTPLDILLAESAGDIVSGLFESNPSKPDRQVYTQEEYFVLPEQLTGLGTQASTPLEHAAYLQFIALLTPRMLDYERRRLLERSLLALDQVDPSSSYYNLLKARALFHLYRRPAAMAYLGDTESPAELALKEYLNGNHPELQALLPQIDDPLLQAVAWLEFVELNAEYLKQPVDEQYPMVSNQAMHALLTGAAKDTDEWYAPANVAFFSKLKGLLPEFDKRFESILTEQMVSGDFELFSDNKGVMQVVFSRSRGVDGPACCHSYKGQLEEADLWSLYRNLSIANNFRQLNRSVNVRGSYGAARELAEQLEPRFQGHPRFTRLYAQTLEGDAHSKQGTERNYLLKKAYDLSRQVRIDAGGADEDTIKASYLEHRIVKNLPPSDRAGPGSSIIYLPAREQPSGKRYAEYTSKYTALPFTNEDFYTLESAIRNEKINDEMIQDVLDTRFNGHPGKPVFLAERLKINGRTDDAIALLRKEVESGNNAWHVYNELGKMLIQGGEYPAASQAFMAYPGFREPGDLRVAISNYAYEAGSRLFWLGRHKEAEPLYEVAVDLNTGSGAEYAAGQRLAMLQGDFRTAIAYAYKRGQRYNDLYGFRDYLAFMHLLGYHNDAEAGFRALAPRYNTPQLWTSMFVGQRKQARTLDEVESWTDDYLAESDSNELQEQARRYTFMYSFIDRNPETVSVPSGSAAGDSQTIRKSHARRSLPLLSEVVADRSQTEEIDDRSCTGNEEKCEAHAEHNPDMYDSFMNAYVLLRSGKHEDALQGFIRLDEDHNIMDSWSPTHFAAPYVAMTMVAPDQDSALSRLPGTLVQQKNRDKFIFALTNAITWAQLGNTDMALDALTNAYHKRPHTASRPIYTWYQLTETAEWLYKKTGDKRFIDRALEWAKLYQEIQPQFAWAYAFEALYSTNQDDRIRAAGYAIYLDPNSAWLEQVSADIREKGITWWEENNPYKAITEDINKPETSASSEA